MRSVVPFGMAVFAVAGLAWIGLFGHAQEKPKYSIKEVMKAAHKEGGPLCKQVVSGAASKAEREKLLELYVALAANKCPKGDAKDWEERTKALVAGAKAAVAKEKDVDALKKALNCKGCHDGHR